MGNRCHWAGRVCVPIFFILAVLLGSCAEDESLAAGTGSLIDHYSWEAVASSDDFFASPMLDAESCVDGDGYLAELFGQDLVLSVSTEQCASVTVEQPLLVNLPKGTWVEGRLWHFSLAAPSPAAGWAAFAVEGTIVWAQAIEIPAQSGLVRIQWQAPRDLLAGESMRFHLQNHGDNSWHLIDLVVKE